MGEPYRREPSKVCPEDMLQGMDRAVPEPGGRHTEETKSRARIFFEANGWSATRIADAIGVKAETVMEWVRDGRWVHGGRPDGLMAKVEVVGRMGRDIEASRTKTIKTKVKGERPVRARLENTVMSAAALEGAGLRYQIAKARYLCESRMAVVATEQGGFQLLPVDPATWDKDTKTFALWDGARIGVDQTVPNVPMQIRALNTLMKATGVLDQAGQETKAEMKRLMRQEERELENEGDGGDKGVMVQVFHPREEK